MTPYNLVSKHHQNSYLARVTTFPSSTSVPLSLWYSQTCPSVIYSDTTQLTLETQPFSCFPQPQQPQTSGSFISVDLTSALLSLKTLQRFRQQLPLTLLPLNTFHDLYLSLMAYIFLWAPLWHVYCWCSHLVQLCLMDKVGVHIDQPSICH